jgi:hypothetical protein
MSVAEMFWRAAARRFHASTQFESSAPVLVERAMPWPLLGVHASCAPLSDDAAATLRCEPLLGLPGALLGISGALGLLCALLLSLLGALPGLLGALVRCIGLSLGALQASQHEVSRLRRRAAQRPDEAAARVGGITLRVAFV